MARGYRTQDKGTGGAAKPTADKSLARVRAKDEHLTTREELYNIQHMVGTANHPPGGFRVQHIGWIEHEQVSLHGAPR